MDQTNASSQSSGSSPGLQPGSPKPRISIITLISICFLIGAIILCIPKKKLSSYVTQEGTFERNVEDIFQSTIDERILNIKKSYHSVKDNSERFVIEIEYMTIHRTRILLLDDAIKFLAKIFSDAKCNQIEVINLYPHSTLVDKYGKESVEQIAMLQLNRTIASKINWPNMSPSLLEKVLSSEGVLWFHRCLEK